MNVEVKVPEALTSDVIGDLNGKRGRVLGMEPSKKFTVIKAQVPLAEMVLYAIELKSLTQGRGSFRMEFDHYEDIPGRISEEIIAAAKVN